MENASKALIIAGAILLSILIIAIGMYIYNSSQNSIATAGSQISAQEVESFNKTWEMYEGVQTGTNVKSLISKMSANAKANETESTRLPDLTYYAASDTDKHEVYSEVGELLNIEGFNEARTAIQPRHNYIVELHQANNALIDWIIIKYSTSTATPTTAPTATP